MREYEPHIPESYENENKEMNDTAYGDLARASRGLEAALIGTLMEQQRLPANEEGEKAREEDRKAIAGILTPGMFCSEMSGAMFHAFLLNWSGGDKKLVMQLTLDAYPGLSEVQLQKHLRDLHLMVGEHNIAPAHALHYAKEIYANWQQRRFYQIGWMTCERATAGQMPQAEILAKLQDHCDEMRVHLSHTADRQDACDLIENGPEQAPVVIDDLVREGQIMNVVSDPKVGKSWLAYRLAIEVCQGTAFLGRFKVKQDCKVLLVDNELTKAELRERLTKVTKAMDLQPIDLQGRFYVECLRGREESLASVSGRIMQGDFGLIILDAKYRFEDMGDENSNQEQAHLYQQLIHLAERSRAAIVTVHHATKGEQGSKKVADVGAGGGAQSRAADAHVVIRAHQDHRHYVLDAIARSFAPMDPVPLIFDYPLWHEEKNEPVDVYALEGAPRPSALRKKDASECAQAVYAILAKHLDEWLGWGELDRRVRAASDLSTKEVQLGLDDLLASGTVLEERKGNRRSYKLKGEGNAEG